MGRTLLLRWGLQHDLVVLPKSTRPARIEENAIVMGPVAYAVGAGLAWVNEMAAFVCYGAIALYFVFPHSVRASR